MGKTDAVDAVFLQRAAENEAHAPHGEIIRCSNGTPALAAYACRLSVNMNEFAFVDSAPGLDALRIAGKRHHLMKNNPVGWFEIYVQEMNRAKAFYETVFATTLEKLPSAELEMWTFGMGNESYGAPGALVKMDGCASGGGGTLVYFSCDDCAVEESRVVAAGGAVFKTKFSIGQYGFIALVTDTERNLIGLHSMK